MDMFSIDLTLNEIQILRTSLDVITISGKDAKALASLQTKLEYEIHEIQIHLQQQELQKQQELMKAVETDKKMRNKG